MKYIVWDWSGAGVVRGHWRKAKAEWRRGNKLDYCAWIKKHRRPDQEGQVFWHQEEKSSWKITFHESSRLGRAQIKESQ